jgi:hypothetical protein
MVFSQASFTDPQKVGGGELKGTTHVILTSTDFEDGLYVGRFAQYVSGSPSLKNMDGTASPVIAGIPKRFLGRSVEAGDTLDKTYQTHVEYVRFGIVTVDVRSGESPERFGRVYVSNNGDADDGLATADPADLEVNATFLHEVGDGAWAILLNEPLGDFTPATTGKYVPERISDPGDAGTIENDQTGNLAIDVASGNETRTLPDPADVGHYLSISLNTNAGTDVTITANSPLNSTGNNTITMSTVGESVTLTSDYVSDALVWRVVENDASLSTV